MASTHRAPPIVVPTPWSAPRLTFDRAIGLATLGPFLGLLALHLVGGAPRWLLPVAILLGTPHVLATAGLYLDRDLRKVVTASPARYLLAPALAVVGSATAFALAGPRATALLITGFLLWQTYHFTKQNVGMFAFWTRARDLGGMQPAERSLILCTAAIGMVGILRAVDLAPTLEPLLRGLGLGLVAGCAAVACRLADGPRRVALLVAIAFFAPLHLFSVGVAGAALAYQAAHGAQYYLMVGRVIRRDRTAVRTTVVLVLVGGLALVAVGSGAVLAATPWLYGLAKGVVAAHFVADAGLWRLRDPEIRSVMKDRFSFL